MLCLDSHSCFLLFSFLHIFYIAFDCVPSNLSLLFPPNLRYVQANPYLFRNTPRIRLCKWILRTSGSKVKAANTLLCALHAGAVTIDRYSNLCTVSINLHSPLCAYAALLDILKIFLAFPLRILYFSVHYALNKTFRHLTTDMNSEEVDSACFA